MARVLELRSFQRTAKYSGRGYGTSEHRPSSQATKVFSYLLQNLQPAAMTTSAWEDKQEASTFYEEIKPVMILLRILGVLPYSTTSTGAVHFKWLSAAMLYSIGFVGSISTCVGFTLMGGFAFNTDSKDSFSEKTIVFAARLFISSVFIVPINHWPETGKKMRFINSWTELQTEYRKITGRRLHLELRRKVIVCLSVSAVLIPTFSLMVYFTGIMLYWWQIFGFIFAFAITMILPFIWVFTCTAITKVARDLADEIEQHLPRGFVTVGKISSYSKFWLRLRKLMQDLGSSSGFTYGGQILIYFAMSVLLSYGFMVDLGDNYNYAAVSSALLFQIVIFVQCNSAQEATNEASTVGTKFSERLQSITNDLPVTCTEQIKEMRYFLSVIGRNPPTISFSGFVDVNRGLVTSFISAMATYLVVLVQFQMSDKSSEQNDINA
ncbi:hypothetical protein L798_06244 [Zootermopsis nevadensis]|uniref:Gustatory receptor n=1 Tax=Zootermopsis nevadensis TaxID=136037 RepID=A0A067R6Y0_ZOONE|nr:hypothetical protein L798_06244 [Zootermopsis nevadensis]